MNGTRRDFAKATLAGLSPVARMAGVAGPAVKRSSAKHPQAQSLTMPERRGGFKELTEAKDAPPGNIAAGNAYFVEKCGSCHSASGDMARIASKYTGPKLKAVMLKPNVMDEPSSWKLEQLHNVRKAAARQQHQRLLENDSAVEASNLTAYLATLK